MHGFVCRCEKCEVRSASPLGIAAVSSASSQGAACEQVQRGVTRVRKTHPAGSDERLEAQERLERGFDEARKRGGYE